MAKKEKQPSEIEMKYEQRLKDASNTISFLNSAVSVLGVFLAILGLGLPILTHQFGIKPSQDAVEKLEQTMDEKIATYLENKRNNEIDNAIDSLYSNADINRLIALSYLGNQAFKRDQVFRIVDVLKSERLHPDEQQRLMNSFVFQKSDVASDFFTSIVKLG